MSKLSKAKLIGKCGVDSGQLLITDPCYIRDFINNEYQDIRQYKNSQGDILEFRKDFSNYDETIEKYGKTMNQLTDEKVFSPVERKDVIRRTTDKSYSYDGCCNATLSKKQGGSVGGLGVAISSGYGDGEYPVYAHYNDDGRVALVVIDFQ